MTTLSTKMYRSLVHSQIVQRPRGKTKTTLQITFMEALSVTMEDFTRCTTDERARDTDRQRERESVCVCFA